MTDHDEQDEERGTEAMAIGRTGTGSVQSVRSVLCMLDDREELERSRKASQDRVTG